MPHLGRVLARLVIAGAVLAASVGVGTTATAAPTAATFTSSATPSEVAACVSDKSRVRRDPYAAVFWAKRGQVWYATTSQASRPAGLCFVFGNPGDIGLVADWGAGYPTPAVFRPSTGEWFLGATEFGSSVREVRRLGGPGDWPVAGDWNGDGRTDIGVVRDGVWHLQTNPRSTVAQGTRRVGVSSDWPLRGLSYPTLSGSDLGLAFYRPANSSFHTRRDTDVQRLEIPFGNPGDQPMTNFTSWFGDSYGSGGPAVFRPSTATVHLATVGPLPASPRSFQFGRSGDQMLVSSPACYRGRFSPQPCRY
jgi:hypothetical protein